MTWQSGGGGGGGYQGVTADGLVPAGLDVAGAVSSVFRGGLAQIFSPPVPAGSTFTPMRLNFWEKQTPYIGYDAINNVFTVLVDGIYHIVASAECFANTTEAVLYDFQDGGNSFYSSLTEDVSRPTAGDMVILEISYHAIYRGGTGTIQPFLGNPGTVDQSFDGFLDVVYCGHE